MMRAGVLLICLIGAASAVNVPFLHPHKDYVGEKCPDGYVRKHNHCVKPAPISQEEVCPPGSIDTSDTCVVTAPAKLECSQGSYVGNLWCEVVANAPSELVCPEGTEQQGSKCFVGTSLTICPAGTAQLEDGQCEKIVPRPLFCPSGLLDTGNFCLDTNVVPPTLICPEGTILQGNKCIVEITRQPICPKGASDEGEECAFFFPTKFECPAGFVSRDGACVDVTTTPVTPICADGGELVNHHCRRFVEGPTSPFCSEGALVNYMCIAKTDIPVSYKCPQGYSLENGKLGPVCVATVEYDCSTTHYECDPTKEKDLKVKIEKKNPTDMIHEHLRHLDEIKTTEIIPHPDELVHNIHHYCYKVPVVTPKTCEKTTTADPIPFCGEGVFNGKKNCEITVEYPPATRCDGFVDDDGECLMEEKYAPVYECPEGFTRNHKDCEKVETAPATQFCPHDTVEFEGQCASFVDKKCPHGGCSSIISTLPEEVCPDNFVLVRDGGLYKSECILNEYTEKEIADCPAGTTPISETTCAKTVAAVVVDDVEFVKPQVVCPVGFFEKHGECLSIRYELAIPICPAGFEVVLGTEMCAKEVETIWECPKGSHEINGECFIQLKVRPITVDSPIMKTSKEIPQIPMPKVPTVPLPPVPAPPKITATVAKTYKTIPIPSFPLPQKFLPNLSKFYIPTFGK